MEEVLRVLKIERIQHAELPAAVTTVVVPPPLVLVKDEPKETVPEVAGHDDQSTALVLFSDTPVSKGNQILSQMMEDVVVMQILQKKKKRLQFQTTSPIAAIVYG
ncbi:unnamed protein product [Sphagnum balticum]